MILPINATTRFVMTECEEGQLCKGDDFGENSTPGTCSDTVGTIVSTCTGLCRALVNKVKQYLNGTRSCYATTSFSPQLTVPWLIILSTIC